MKDNPLLKIPEPDLNFKDKEELLISAAAVVAGYGMKQLLEYVYEEIYDEEAPNNIDDREVNWFKVIGWTVVSGVAATAVKMLIKRGAGKKI